MRDDKDTSGGSAELKAVASEALQLGKRAARGARQWLAQKRGASGQRDRDQASADDLEQARSQYSQPSSWQEDHAQQARGGDAEDTGGRASRAEQTQRYQYGSEDRDEQGAGRSRRDQQAGRYTGQYAADDGDDRWQGSSTQASDQLPDGRYAGHTGAQRGGQGQGRPWESQYNNQPAVRQGGQGQGRAAGTQSGSRNSDGGHHLPTERGHRGRGPKGYARADERIAEDLCEKLADDDSIDASDMSVEVRQGVAILTGTVEQRWMKHHVENLAGHCSGVKDVDNQVRVQGRGELPAGPETVTTPAESALTGTEGDASTDGVRAAGNVAQEAPPTSPAGEGAGNGNGWSGVGGRSHEAGSRQDS